MPSGWVTLRIASSKTLESDRYVLAPVPFLCDVRADSHNPIRIETGTIMSNQPEYRALPPAVQRAASNFHWVGWIGFWVQTVLAAVSTVLMLFAVPFLQNTGAGGGTAGVGLATMGLFALYFSIFWAFRYTRIARRLKTPEEIRPKRSETLKNLRMGLIINLVGMLLALLAAEAILGSLFARSSQFQGGFTEESLKNIVKPLDISVVLANTHIIISHYAGLVTSLFLLNRVSR